MTLIDDMDFEDWLARIGGNPTKAAWCNWKRTQKQLESLREDYRNLYAMTKEKVPKSDVVVKIVYAEKHSGKAATVMLYNKIAGVRHVIPLDHRARGDDAVAKVEAQQLAEMLGTDLEEYQTETVIVEMMIK